MPPEWGFHIYSSAQTGWDMSCCSHLCAPTSLLLLGLPSSGFCSTMAESLFYIIIVSYHRYHYCLISLLLDIIIICMILLELERPRRHPDLVGHFF